jgi:hypothetical protein
VDDFLLWAQEGLNRDLAIVEGYLFGSALRDWYGARDIDLLILTRFTSGNLSWRPLGGCQSWEERAIHFTVCNQRELREFGPFLGSCGATRRIK